MPEEDFLSSSWVDNEAHRLFTRTRQEIFTESTISSSKILLAGYGFKEIVVKKVNVP